MEITPKPAPVLPTRINKYEAWQRTISLREADKLIEAGTIFINNRKAVLGDKVTAADKVEYRYSGKQPSGGDKNNK